MMYVKKLLKRSVDYNLPSLLIWWVNSAWSPILNKQTHLLVFYIPFPLVYWRTLLQPCFLSFVPSSFPSTRSCSSTYCLITCCYLNHHKRTPLWALLVLATTLFLFFYLQQNFRKLPYLHCLQFFSSVLLLKPFC